MKKKTRKILQKIVALISIGTITLTITGGVGPVYAETKKVSGYELLLNRIGISAEYDEDAYITRGDFAVLAVQASKVAPYEGESFFTDISGEQAGYINAAVHLGIVSKNDSGLFYPERIITLNEATAMCLRLLGYAAVLNAPDAYPTKYVAQATKIKLYDGLSSGQELTGANAAKLIYNTLDSNYIDRIIYTPGGNDEYHLSNTTYLAERFGVKKSTGVVTAINETSLNGHSSVREEYMTIDSRKYLNPYYSGFGYYTYLGRLVDYYVLDTVDGAEIVYIKDRSETQTVNFTDVIKVSGFDAGDPTADKNMPKLTFRNESGNSETVSIKADATILVNGEKKLVIKNEDFKLPSGQVALTDYDGDNIYDVAAIEQHTYCRVEYFDPTTGKLEVEDEKIFIDIDDFRKDDIVFMAGEREVGPEILVEDAVLQIMCSFKDNGAVDTDKVIVMSLKNQTVEGTIDAVSSDGKFRIDGTYYKVMPNLVEELKSRMGQKTVFYLGNDNLIVYYKEFYDKVALIYSYLVEMGWVSNNLNDEMHFLVYTENEEMEEYTLADRIRFTGVYNGKYVVGKTIKKEKYESIIQPKQLIRYNINENGLIDYVELAYDHSLETDYKGFDENRFSLDYAARSAFMYQRYLGNNYKSNSLTVYFYVSSTSNDEEDFSCYHYMDLGHQADVNVKIYDSDSLLQPTIVVIEDFPKSSIREQDNTGSFTIVVNKCIGINEDGEDAVMFDTYQGNTFIAESNDIAPLNRAHYNIPTTVTNISQIENGDIIKFGRRKNGEVDRFIVLSEYDPTHTDSSWGAYANDFEDRPYMAEIQYVKGKITSYVPNSHITIDAPEAEGQRFTFSRRSLTYIEYNVEDDKVTYSTSMPRLTVGDYVWFQASSGCEITTLIRYINE